MDSHNLYSEHADTIESVLASTRRSRRLSADDGDEFSSWARLRLLEDECAVLRKFQGISSFKTFLVAVIQHLFLDWRDHEWGKWRNSAEAVRLGPVAKELERLVLRDGTDYEQAVQSLVSRRVAESVRQCDEIWAKLSHRPPRRRASTDELDDSDHRVAAVDPVEEHERRERIAATRRAMHDAIRELPPADQLIIKLRFDDHVTVARIAKLVDEDQKALYRRFERLMKQLRQSMNARGISDEDLSDLFGSGGDDFGPIFGNRGGGPSTLPNAGGVNV